MDEIKWTNEYRTGRTDPREGRRGLLCGLLMAVIFVVGIFTGLGLLNIPLHRQEQALAQKEDSSVSFYRSGTQDGYPEEAASDSLLMPELGLRFQEPSPLYQRMYRLPRGLYITRVAESSDASAKGIVPGDVLTALDGKEVPSLAALQRLLYAHEAGDPVEVVIFRNGQLFRFCLTIDQTEKD